MGARSARVLAAGWGVMAVLLGLLVLNLIEVVRGWEELQPVWRGRRAPAFSLPRAAGGSFALAELRGQVVLVSFWAEWCKPCVAKMPLLARWQRELGAQGLRVVTINTEGNAAEARRFDAITGRGLVMLVDDGRVSARYGVHSLPHLLLLGREGEVRAIFSGQDSGAEVERRIRGELRR